MHLLLCSCLFFCFNPHAGSTFASAFKRVCCTNYSCVYDVLIVLLLHVYFTIITLFGDSISVRVQVLLSQDELLQLSGVQCIGEVLTSHPDYGRTLLNADIAGTYIRACAS